MSQECLGNLMEPGYPPGMALYRRDLAYVHAEGFESWIDVAAPALLEVLRRSVAPGALVVDLGCGSGAWIGKLLDAGYRAVGIDASPSMIALARRRVPEAVLRTGTIARAPLPRCQAVTAFGECFNYREPRGPSLAALFARIRRALAPGGLFLFDVREPSARAVPDRLVHTLGRDWAVLLRVEERGRALTRHVTTFRRAGRALRRSREVHRLRLHPRGEVARALRAAGFTVRIRARLGRVRLKGNRVAFFARRR